MTTATLLKENNGAGLQLEMFNPLTGWWEEWSFTGRRGAGEGTWSSISGSAGSGKREALDKALEF